MKSPFSFFPPPLTVISVRSLKSSLIAALALDSVCSGQTGMSQEVFTATPKLLCNRDSY